MPETSQRPNSFAATASSVAASASASASASDCSSALMLSHRFLRVTANQFDERDTVYLLDLVVDTGDVTHRTTLRPTDAGDGDLVVLVDETDRAVAGTERRDLFPVLDE